MSASPESNLGKVRTPAHPGRPGAVQPGRSPGKSGSSTDVPQVDGKHSWIYPLARKAVPGGGVAAHNSRPLGNWQSDNAIDLMIKAGTPILAVEDGTISPHGLGYGIQSTTGVTAGFRFHLAGASGNTYFYQHMAPHGEVAQGRSVKAGDIIGHVGNWSSFPNHLHFASQPPLNPEYVIAHSKLVDGTSIGAGGGSSGGGGGGGGGTQDPAAVARAAALSTFIQLPGIFDTFESNALAGQRSLMNDQPLLPFIQQLAQASLRNIQSMPNGDFYAFFPDYFGGLSHRTPYWHIDDIEIIDGSIDLSDDALATHVFVVGDIAPSFGTVDITDKVFSSGVVTIFNAFSSNFITGLDAKNIQTSDHQNHKATAEGTGALVTLADEAAQGIDVLAEKEGALNFLQKYGARPYYEEAPMVRSPFFELFLAYQKFMLLWAQQFITTFEFTFMPELFPGGLVAFPDHGIQCYVAEVEHEFDFENGFTTKANLMAPAALPSADRQNIHNGMVRAFAIDNTDTPFDPFAASRNKRKKKDKHGRK